MLLEYSIIPCTFRGIPLMTYRYLFSQTLRPEEIEKINKRKEQNRKASEKFRNKKKTELQCLNQVNNKYRYVDLYHFYLRKRHTFYFHTILYILYIFNTYVIMWCKFQMWSYTWCFTFKTVHFSFMCLFSSLSTIYRKEILNWNRKWRVFRLREMTCTTMSHLLFKCTSTVPLQTV